MSTDTIEPDFQARLQQLLGSNAHTGTRPRAEYSTDASNYRVIPMGVVTPRDTDDIIAIRELCEEFAVPITARGGGTSVAGNSIGPGLIIDTTRHMNRVLTIDTEQRTATVQPGAIISTIQEAAKPHGLRFGPDPSTFTRCAVGGVLGNNACGPHSLAYGKAADNIISMDWLSGTGGRFTAAEGLEPIPGLDELIGQHLAIIRTEFGRFERQVSGYSLEHLLPERGRNLAKALVGTEGTCGIALEATVALHPLTASPVLVVLGYDSMAEAADDVPHLLPFSPLAMEGIDQRLVDVVRRAHGEHSVPPLPGGAGWLFVEVPGDTLEHATDAAQQLIKASHATAAALYPPGPEATRLWNIRADGAGLAGRTASGAQAWPGWEDAAVPPEHLGRYLRDFEALLDEHDLTGLPYGHFGDGCIHVRLDMPLETHPGRMRPFITDATALILKYGGSPSGEHGDGRARSELLERMYSPQALTLFRQFKHLCDPKNLFNPGVIVDPEPFDANLRRPQALPIIATNGFSFSEDAGDATASFHRCVGVGKCRATSGGFMCPSFRATGDEKDSTRARARVLQEMANGELITDGYASPEVLESLDLCLSCKACGSECPTGIDMATFKAEALYRAYEGKLRPLTHYTLGWLPRWAKLLSPIAPIVNAASSLSWFRKPALYLAGMDSRRGIPRFARDRLHRQLGMTKHKTARRGDRPVTIWADSFTEFFSPEQGFALLELLTEAGYSPEFAAEGACCGLTWISTGQLDGARERLRNTMSVLLPSVEEGRVIVGIEPSCTAVLRSDLTALFPLDERAKQLAQNTQTLAELLSEALDRGWQPPNLSGTTIVVQPHCHHEAVMQYRADLRVLEATGATLVQVEGCCGLAGNFGMERGHYEISVAVAENGIMPILRKHPDALVLADGFSCQTQIDQLAGRESVHLATLLLSASREARRV